MRYRSAPSFYAIASSKPIEKIVDERTRAIYELGVESLQLSPAGQNAWGANQCANDPDGAVDHDERLRITGAG